MTPRSTTVRRTVGFILTVILTVIAGYQLAWQKGLRDKFFNHPLQSLGLLVLAIAAIAVFIHATANPHHGSALLGAILGVAAVVWGHHLFSGIKWTTLGLLALTLLAVAVLWGFTVLGESPVTKPSRTAKARLPFTVVRTPR